MSYRWFCSGMTCVRLRRSGTDRMRRRLIAFGCVAGAALAGLQFLPVQSAATPGDDAATELQAQLDAAPPGGYVRLESRVYEHSETIQLRVPGVHVDGNGATLRATNDATSAIQITADGVQLTNVNLTAPTDGRRWSDLDQHKIAILGDQVTVANVSIVGSAAAGIFVDSAQNFRIENVSITGSRADGVHITGGSGNGVVANVRTTQTGDDAVAVVSHNSEPCRDIQINGVAVANTRWGRGIAVVGGKNVAVRDFSVANTSSAGVYVASEGDPYYTDAIESVSLVGGTLTNANRNPGVVQGAILVYSGNSDESVSDVQISGVKIAGTPASALRNVAVVVDGGSASRISLKEISITDSAVSPFFTNAPASFSASGWTQDGKAIALT